MSHYNYIISGAGAAGLSLLMRMMQSPFFKHKKILVVDKEQKVKNDRTWCFWEIKDGLFEPIVHHSWQQTHFYSNYFSGLLNLFPYKYKMIRGIDFYNYVLAEASKHSNISFAYGSVNAVGNEGNQAMVLLDDRKLTADYVFNSIMFSQPTIPADKYMLLQHFKGFIIETPNPVFNPTEATLMDFRVSQTHGTTFVYVLPLSATKALVEYTLFTKEVLPREAYEVALHQYIKTFLNLYDYQVLDEEYGIIPMTNIKFNKNIGNVFNIGTVGGQTKASSGYTFQFIQKQTQAIVDDLEKYGYPKIEDKLFNRRFQLYDSTLLNILSTNKLNGDRIFADLFKKNDPATVLRFLDNESDLEDEIKIMTSVPSGVFLKAALQEMFK